MGLIRMIQGKLSNKKRYEDNDSLYFTKDTNQVYISDRLYNDAIRKVTETPESPAEDIIYLFEKDANRTYDEYKIYHNGEWISLNINNKVIEDLVNNNLNWIDYD